LARLFVTRERGGFKTKKNTSEKSKEILARVTGGHFRKSTTTRKDNTKEILDKGHRGPGKGRGKRGGIAFMVNTKKRGSGRVHCRAKALGRKKKRPSCRDGGEIRK